mmetsp:Transcript_19680/g.63969  ORF Transcript_19680/g.63969 Transcript_19680/m.63969 type:complete len:344 (+) Transcript_19680:168-1199(+)
METSPACLRDAAVEYSSVSVWISLSAGVILFNKWILSYMPFPYPLALTLMHMGFCSTLAFILIKVLRVVKPSAEITLEKYTTNIVPVGLLYALSLWLSNSAYIYLSVAFIQMLKALMPVIVYGVGILLKLEVFSGSTLMNMMVITVGVMIASYGELNFVLFGVLVQLGALFAEAFRLSLVQILLTSKGMSLDAMTTLYYLSPACFCFLLVPFLIIELPQIRCDETMRFDPVLMLANASVAFGLNVAVYVLIKRTSALTMNVAGVVKDWILIGLSSVLFLAPIASLSLYGYLLAFAGVCYFNYKKMQAKAAKAAAERAAKAGGEVEGADQALVAAESGASDSSK